MFSTDELPLSPAPDAASAHPCSEGSPLSERPGVDMVLQGMAAGSGLASGRKPAYDGPRACRAPRRNLTDEVRPPAAWAESGLSAELLASSLPHPARQPETEGCRRNRARAQCHEAAVPDARDHGHGDGQRVTRIAASPHQDPTLQRASVRFACRLHKRNTDKQVSHTDRSNRGRHGWIVGGVDPEESREPPRK